MDTMDQHPNASTAEPPSAPTTPPDTAPAAAPAASAERVKNPAQILLYQPQLVGRVCERVETFGKNLHELVQIMYDTLEVAGGVGLAAPQIGAFDRVCIIHHPDYQRVMVNPELVEHHDRNVDWEACLSLPGASRGGKVIWNRARVPRFETVVVRYQTVDGETVEEKLQNMPARIAQHELGHLDGEFFIAHVGPIARNVVLEKYKNFAARVR